MIVSFWLLIFTHAMTFCFGAFIADMMLPRRKP